MTEPTPTIWYPENSQVIGTDTQEYLLMNIIGVSGVGKSHLVNQCVKAFGVEEVYVMMAENAKTTYAAPGLHIDEIRGIWDARQRVEALAKASDLGKRLPKLVFLDSLSGMLDYQRQGYETNPLLTENGGRDKRAEFGEMGNGTIDLYINARDRIKAVVIFLVTTHEGTFNAAPEIAVEGRMVPKNMTRLSNITLYMKAEEIQLSTLFGAEDWPAEMKRRLEDKTAFAPHRTIGFDDSGKPDGSMINRFFITQDTGQVMAKGHHKLNLREKADLPAVLRKIYGENW